MCRWYDCFWLAMLQELITLNGDDYLASIFEKAGKLQRRSSTPGMWPVNSLSLPGHQDPSRPDIHRLPYTLTFLGGQPKQCS
jgi:hypothetical protein